VDFSGSPIFHCLAQDDFGCFPDYRWEAAFCYPTLLPFHQPFRVLSNNIEVFQILTKQLIVLNKDFQKLLFDEKSPPA
jgi:hypothetical protein